MILQHNGIYFDLKNNLYEPPLFERYPHRTLYDCYDSPSDTKKAIYKDWLRYAKSINAQGFTIASYNTNIFTLDFDFYKDRILYHAHITPKHNYLYKHSYQPLLNIRVNL